AGVGACAPARAGAPSRPAGPPLPAARGAQPAPPPCEAPPASAAPRHPRLDGVWFVVTTVLLVLAAGVGQWLWGERIASGHGQGWDGRFYAEMARDFPGEVFGHRLDAYRLERGLPFRIRY